VGGDGGIVGLLLERVVRVVFLGCLIGGRWVHTSGVARGWKDERHRLDKDLSAHGMHGSTAKIEDFETA
jgi:hypothetical protein